MCHYVDLDDWFKVHHHSSVIKSGFFIEGGWKYINFFPSDVPQVDMAQCQTNLDGSFWDWIFMDESTGPWLHPKIKYIRVNPNDFYQCSWEDYLGDAYIHNEDYITHF